MNGEGLSIRQQLVSSCSALQIFHGFVNQKGLTVADVFSDPVLGERTSRATAVFDILSNLSDNIIKKDNHASPEMDKLIIESSCLYEWTLRLFLHIFSRLTPYRELENVKLFSEKIGTFLKQIQKNDVQLFNYFIREMKDLVTLLSLFYDQDRLNVALNLTHFSSKRLALVTAKIRATEEYFEPSLEFDFSVENKEQVESLFICAVGILINVGKPFIVSLGVKSSCEMMSHLVANCISFTSTKMLVISLKLFHRFYPVKCIQLDPSVGFFYQTCWLTVFLFKSSSDNDDLKASVEKNWDLIIKRLDLEAQMAESSVDISKSFSAIIVVTSHLSKMTPHASTKLVNESIAEALHKLIDLYSKHQDDLQLTSDSIKDLQKLFRDKLAASVSHDSLWIPLIKRVYTKNYMEVHSSSDLSFGDNSDFVVDSIGKAANHSGRSHAFFDDFCRANSKVISEFKASQSLGDIIYLHNLYAVERETIASLRINGHCLSNQGNFMLMIEVTKWICDFTLANTCDENIFKFLLSLLIIIVKAIRDFDPPNVEDVERKIALVFMIPHVSATSPSDVLDSINREWTAKHLSSNDLLNVLSLHGLALVKLDTSRFVSNILVTQLSRWKGDDYTFNQTLTFILLKSEQLVKQIYRTIEEKENFLFIAKIIGLVTCFLSSSDKGVIFSHKGSYERCDLVFHCNGCADWISSHNKSSLPEDAECKLMEIFHEIVDTKDPLLLTNLGKWSAARVLRHCGMDRSLLTSIFKLFSIDSKEVVDVLTSVFLPLIMKPIQSGSLRMPKKEMLFRALDKVCGATKRSDSSVEITEINNITNLSTYLDESELHHIFIIFFRKIWSDSGLKGHVRQQMSLIASSRKLELRSLFYRHKSIICNKLIKIVMAEIVQIDPLRGWLCLREALSLFTANQDEAALAPIFTNSLLYFFCAMVEKANDHAYALIENFFAHSDLTASFLTSEFSFGLPRLFVAQSSLGAVEKSLTFVKTINKNDSLSSIFRTDFHNSMLIEYHRNQTVAAYVVYKIYISEDCETTQENFLDSKFITMLEAQMGPFIIALNRFLLKSGDVLEDKRLAVESLGDFLALLGSQKVPNFKMNIMGILLTAYNQAEGEVAFLKTLLKIWQQFLSYCGPNDIGPHLSVICKDLIPYFNVDANATSRIIKRIVNYDNLLKDRFRELHFLPHLPSMNDVHEIIAKYLVTKVPKDPNQARDYLKDNIRYFDQLLNINNPDVKALHVKKLRSILIECKQALAYLCLPNKETSTDKMVAQIIRKLLSSSQISDENLLTCIAECIGEIGAIDPGRLDLSLLSAHQSFDGGFIEFDDLPVTLLSKLANTLDSIDQSRIRDCICYSIQETLKSYNIRENDDIWSKLPADVQRNIKRFFTTKYILKEDVGIVGSPVFHSEITYDEWVYKWSMVLIERIERTTHRRAFEACLAIIKYNSTIARFLLPTIFWMALLDSNETKVKLYIVDEINAIIERRYNEDSPADDTLQIIASSVQNENSQNKSDYNKFRLRCARTVFTILDSVSQLKSRMFRNAKKPAIDDTEFKAQINLLEKNLNKPELAELAFECQAYGRALLYMEEYIEQNRYDLANKLVSFQKYFLSLDEPDEVEGINAIREGPASLMDTILYNEANSELNYSLSCCEIAIKKEPDNLMFPQTLLRCLMNLDQHATAFNYATGLIQRKNQWCNAIYPYMIEASWKLHNWDDLGKMLKENQTLECDSLGVNIGHLIDCIHAKDATNFQRMLRDIRKREMDPLSGSASEQGAYIRCYQHILRLHMLTDIEKFAEFVFKYNSDERQRSDKLQEDFSTLIHDWIRRNNLVQSSLRCQEQVFSLQRVLLSLQDVLPVQTDLERAQCSLSSAKLARKSQNLQRAYTHLVESQDLINNGNLPVSLAIHSAIETAKFHWAKGDQESKEQCIKGLKRALEKYESMEDMHIKDKIKLSKLKLLFTKYSENLSNLDSDALHKMYKKVIEQLRGYKLNNEIEEPFFCLARYTDRIMKAKEVKDAVRPQLMALVCKYYGASLRAGSKHVYESMPRLLSIWCDLGSSCAEFSKTKCAKALEQKYSSALNDLIELMKGYKDEISLHLYYTAFSQLLSRICHVNQSISEILMAIIAKLVTAYPDQSMWMLIGVLMNRKNKTRAEKCAQIISIATRGNNQKLTKFTRDMKTFAQMLIKLCNYDPGEKVRTFCVSKAVPELNDALRKHLSQIMLPYQAFMSVRMKNKFESSHTFRPFPSDAIYIQSFDDIGDVLSSQAKPKKVVINCSDGKKYSVMCKPKDDLRKDARTMELDNLINRLLKRDPETRKRGLHIRTYTVVPLDNDCGLIEWVSNLQCFREAITVSFAFKSPNVPFPTTKELLSIISHDMTKKATDGEIVVAFKKLLNLFTPPVLGFWFAQTFPDPTSWYMARLAFTRSAAVMSVVGYIIGLGDRHTENLLLDSSNGEAMHVDFNLLFNQGDILEYPEKVPFRLTHNMVAAMGVTGYEGAFRKTCEVTLRLMREKKEALMSVLQPFVYDPLCEWKKSTIKSRVSIARSGSLNDKETVEVNNTKALEFVGKIEDRLDGVIKKNAMPISVSGQVQYLIDESTSLVNLGRMYIGWASFM